MLSSYLNLVGSQELSLVGNCCFWKAVMMFLFKEREKVRKQDECWINIIQEEHAIFSILTHKKMVRKSLSRVVTF